LFILYLIFLKKFANFFSNFFCQRTKDTATNVGSEDKKTLARPVLAPCSLFSYWPQMLVLRIETRWKLGVGAKEEEEEGILRY
jgi:hypothetical protein